MFRASRATFSIVMAFFVFIPLAAQAAQLDIKVLYNGEFTTFSELDLLGIEVHCVTQQTSELREGAAFDLNKDVVLCFDNIKEADTYAIEAGIISASSNKPKSEANTTNDSSFMLSCTDWFAMYDTTGYNGHVGDVCSDYTMYFPNVWSIWEVGAAAMRVYKAYNFTSSSWLIAEPHFTLANGWGGAIRSIDFF